MSGPATFKAAFRGLDPSADPRRACSTQRTYQRGSRSRGCERERRGDQGQITFHELDVAFSGLGLAQQQASLITIASAPRRSNSSTCLVRRARFTPAGTSDWWAIGR